MPDQRLEKIHSMMQGLLEKTLSKANFQTESIAVSWLKLMLLETPSTELDD
jgi:hypothetical protein